MSAVDPKNPQRQRTERYFRTEVSPLIQDFVAACLRHRPDDVAQFACHYFGSEGKIDATQVGMNNLSREDYEFCFLKPAKEVILEPLVHRLLHAMPSNPLRFLQRQFSMFAVIIKQFSEGLTSSLDREELSAFLESIGLEKNEAELQAIIQQVDANKDGVIDLAEFAIRIPFDISDAVVDALRRADRKLQVVKHMETYFNCESASDCVPATEVLQLLQDCGLADSRRFVSLVSFLKQTVSKATRAASAGGAAAVGEKPISEYVARLKDRATQELLDRALNEAIAVRQMRWQVDIRDQIVAFFDIDRSGHLQRGELLYLLQELNFFSRAVNDVIDELGGVSGNAVASGPATASRSVAAVAAEGGQPLIDLQAFAAAIPRDIQRQLLVAITNSKRQQN